MRAIHFYNENKRVEKAVECLESNDFEGFKRVIIDSGRSSFMLNQNVYTPKNPTEQKLSLALAVSEEILNGKGAWRVHGGGFAGTILVFAKKSETGVDNALEIMFGKDNVFKLAIRDSGAAKLDL